MAEGKITIASGSPAIDTMMEADKILSWLRLCVDGDTRWRHMAQEDFNFFLNKQWEDADIASLDFESRPHLTLNLIKPVIKVLSGIERQQRLDIKYMPVHDNDILVADMYNFMSSVIMDRTNGYHESSLQFQDGIVCGRGFLYINIDFNQNLLYGSVEVSRISPFNVYIDPNSRRYDLADAAYVFRVIYARPEELAEIYPDLAAAGVSPSFLSLRANLSHGTRWSEKDPVLPDQSQHLGLVPVVECWYRSYERYDALVDTTTGRVAYIPANDPQQQAESKILVAESGGEIQRLKNGVSRPRIFFKTMVGGTIVDSGVSPLGELNMFPIIPFFSEFTPASDRVEDRYMGVVRSLKDPQKEMNKRRSQMLNIMNNMAHSGWLTDKDAFVDKSAVKRHGSTPGVIIEKMMGKNVEQLKPTPISRFFLDIEAISERNIKVISNINSDLMGQYEKTTPGIAMKLRQQQGLMSSQDIFDNLRITRKMLGKALVHAIHTAMPEEEIVKRVSGKKEFDDRDVEELLAALVQRGPFELDVAVSESAHSPTQRMQHLITLVELRQMGIPISPITILQATDLPNKEQLIQQIEKEMEALTGTESGTQSQDGVQQARGKVMKELKKEVGSQ